MTVDIKAAPERRPARPATLPGDPRGKAKVGRMIRVDQAGELGATEIYRGQIAVLGDQPCAPLLVEMADQEAEHLAAFDKLVLARG
ncbi:MAG: demethoxyubiquinone hydroxylase family protein, partial [Rhodospirillaceae bacterium]|nr:demethoxyubiquinone hydroxylase family protein [Rhodospirillaceae bacterium]